jgi:hypothetical protein
MGNSRRRCLATVYGLNLRAKVRRIGMRLDSAGGFRAMPVKGQQRCIGRFLPPSTYRPAHIDVLSRLAAEEERRILLHEMVHCHLHFAGLREDQPHGALFVAELERLASMGEGWAEAGLRRQGSHLWAVLAVWDLTELEPALTRESR